MNIKEIGAMLYLCEGSKIRKEKGRWNRRRIELCNSNPHIIKGFLKYLRTKQIDESHLKARLALHYGDNEALAKTLWSVFTSIPTKDFGKTQWRKQSSNRHNRLEYGTITIRYYDAQLFRVIMEDIKETIAKLY